MTRCSVVRHRTTLFIGSSCHSDAMLAISYTDYPSLHSYLPSFAFFFSTLHIQSRVHPTRFSTSSSLCRRIYYMLYTFYTIFLSSFIIIFIFFLFSTCNYEQASFKMSLGPSHKLNIPTDETKFLWMRQHRSCRRSNSTHTHTHILIHIYTLACHQ